MTDSSSICSDITAFKDFLRISRTLVDDTITQNLNNLILPVRFDPHSTAETSKQVVRDTIDSKSCDNLISTVFANWDARSEVIDKCLRSVPNQSSLSPSSPVHAPSKEQDRARRLDPYSYRDETEDPILRHVCLQELGTENIIRDRTWRVIRNRCNLSGDWKEYARTHGKGASIVEASQ